MEKAHHAGSFPREAPPVLRFHLPYLPDLTGCLQGLCTRFQHKTSPSKAHLDFHKLSSALHTNLLQLVPFLVRGFMMINDGIGPTSFPGRGSCYFNLNPYHHGETGKLPAHPSHLAANLGVLSHEWSLVESFLDEGQSLLNSLGNQHAQKTKRHRFNTSNYKDIIRNWIFKSEFMKPTDILLHVLPFFTLHIASCFSRKWPIHETTYTSNPRLV